MMRHSRGPGRACGGRWAGVLLQAGVALSMMMVEVGAPRAEEEQAVLEKLQHGEVNWTKKVVLATGSGAPDLKQPNVAAVRLNAERAALLAAYRNVLETLKGVKVTSGVLGDRALADVTTRTQVEGLIKGCKTVDTRYYSDGGVDVVIRCPLDGGLSTLIAPAKDRKPVKAEGEKKFTGLIVDAVGLKVAPAIAPRVLDEAGAELFAREMVEPSALRQSGATTYARTVEAARRDPRVGANPLVVKASATGAVTSDVVLPKAEADKLASENLVFLAEGRVIIATDGP